MTNDQIEERRKRLRDEFEREYWDKNLGRLRRGK